MPNQASKCSTCDSYDTKTCDGESRTDEKKKGKEKNVYRKFVSLLFLDLIGTKVCWFICRALWDYQIAGNHFSSLFHSRNFTDIE